MSFSGHTIVLTLFLLLHGSQNIYTKIFVNGQSSCNNGNGRVLYERLPNQQLQGFDDDVVRDTGPPFRVLEKCQDLCLRDKTASNSLVRSCSSFDFQPGSRIVSYSGTTEYEESTCYLTREQPSPEGIGILMQVPNSVHFTEVCMRSSRPERECPSRRYVFERHPRKRLKLAISDVKEVMVSNRSECEDKCLNEYSFICRSASYDSITKNCALSRFTRRSHPALLEDDPNSDYLENTCLNAERRCDGVAIFVKEINKGLSGPFEVDIFNNMTLEECQMMCIRAEKYFCRSVEYDEKTKQCSLSEEDSVSQKDDIINHSSPTHNFYDLICLESLRGQDYMENSGNMAPTSHLFTNGLRPETAFQRYRNSRLASEFHSEITGRSLSECLDECLRQTSFQCRSSVYSERFRTCRLSRYNQVDGMRIIYDADYDYFENLMLSGTPHDDKMSPTTQPPYNRGNNGDRYPPDRYSPGSDRYSPGSDRYSPGSDRYSPGSDRFSAGADRYSPGSDRYSPGSDRYRPGEIYRPYRIPNEIPQRENYPPRYPLYKENYSPNSDNSYRNPFIQKYDSRPLYDNKYGNKYFREREYDRRPNMYDVPMSGYNSYRHNLRENYPFRQRVRITLPWTPNVARPEATAIKTSSGRCDNEYLYRRVGYKQRIRPQYVRNTMRVSSLHHCQQACNTMKDFTCRSFNYLDDSTFYKYAKYRDMPNCELSERDTRDFDLQSKTMLEPGEYDFYERNSVRSLSDNEADCLDVEQTCSEDGMEFTLYTPEGFYGRIYTFGYYDRCFFRGNGGTVNILRISGTHGAPPCGSQRFGESLTNIVVVQFAENVQTGRDKRFNLTCLFRHPGEAVVTSAYIGAGSGSPMPIEYLPAENNLNSKVRLMIIYQNRPTTTIAVGDPLTMRIESQDGYNSIGDIFAYNVVARDPYSGRSIQLIDKFGCSVDSYVFPELGLSRSGDSLEARFNAFKIPESNFLVFEATVRTCREGCQPGQCQRGNRREDRYSGRRKRSFRLNAKNDTSNGTVSEEIDSRIFSEPAEQIREIIEVFESRDEIESAGLTRTPTEEVLCLSLLEYDSLIFFIIFLLFILLCTTMLAGYYYRQQKILSTSKRPSQYPATTYSSSIYDNTNLPYDKLGANGGSSMKLGLDGRSGYNGSFLARHFRSLKQNIGRSEADTCQIQEEPIYLDTSMFEKATNQRN